MKLLLYILILVGILLLPLEATDVGQLIPVEVIAISGNGDSINIETDTGDWGSGRTLMEAFQNMKDTASGVIYLDTAEYLIVEEGMEGALESLRTCLKDSIRVCGSQKALSLDGITNYLSAHRPGVRLKEVGDLDEIPLILEENGRYQMIEK